MATSTIAPNKLTNEHYIYAGEADLDGTTGVAVVTPFSVITSVMLTVKSGTAPAVTNAASLFSYTVSGGTVTVFGWAVTSSSVTTLIDPTSTDTFSFLITGY